MKWIAGALVAGLLLFAPILGFLGSPLAAFYVKGHGEVPPSIIYQIDTSAPLPDPSNLSPIPAGNASDATRFQLARSAGWTVADAIIATAISIAEDGSGNPAALSARNKDGSFDYGLLQINSSHWQACGGQQALSDPFNNFVCGHMIYLSQGWCAWSTYESLCGIGHTSSYRSYLHRAQAAAQVQLPAGQA